MKLVVLVGEALGELAYRIEIRQIEFGDRQRGVGYLPGDLASGFLGTVGVTTRHDDGRVLPGEHPSRLVAKAAVRAGNDDRLTREIRYVSGHSLGVR